VIKDVGAGNSFIDHIHTAEHFRTELWMPSIWTRQMFSAWQEKDGQNEIKKAMDIYYDIMKKPDLEPQFSDATDKMLKELISMAIVSCQS
jgi:trimethylamine:corrinoid methyltransferase-like protein